MAATLWRLLPLWVLVAVKFTSGASGANDEVRGQAVPLSTWKPPVGVRRLAFEIDSDAPKFRIWGRETVQAGGPVANAAGRGIREVREYFDEMLPGLFERTLMLEQWDTHGEIAWVFTGDHGGFTITARSGKVEVVQRHYDTSAFNLMPAGPIPRYPELKGEVRSFSFFGTLRAITVTLDHKLGLEVALNGRIILRETCLLDVRRHQVQVREGRGVVKGNLLVPDPEVVFVKVVPTDRHQTMLGFGGIASPTAYAQLSDEGKEQWWKLISEYNLLIQREYPIGQRLSPAMDNWDRLADATPHNYGDNFPNGEISDFGYIKRLRQLGGQVWFEFWGLPLWIGSDVERYTDAVIRYCEIAKRKSGAPPEIVGIQNEVEQTTEQWQAMTLALRRRLDAAGFTAVRIHMSDDGALRGGIRRAEGFRSSAPVWAAIDYAAAHMYDYQRSFTEPDNYDATLRQWKETIGNKPFLSTELCVNDGRYQVPSYRLALLMGQLYHKNLVLTDAAAICYCWTLLNVEQPSFGWTRTLFVPDPSNGFRPRASSYQLRVFGAYSRRIREGSVRITADSGSADLLVSAFDGPAGGRTLVMLNRSTRPCVTKVNWPGSRFDTIETADPYMANEILPVGNAGDFLVGPGQLITLNSKPLHATQLSVLERRGSDSH
jgi:hypothetical protein